MNAEILNSENYVIISGGTRPAIGYSDNKIFLLFVSGSGYGDQSYWSCFSSTYAAYMHTDGELKLCGEIRSTNSTDGNSFCGTIKGREIACSFLSADEVFCKIELK